jgi:hypothetical protein
MHNLDGIRTRNRWIRSPTRYPIAPQGHMIYVCAKPIARFELATPCLQGRCNNHYAKSAHNCVQKNTRVCMSMIAWCGIRTHASEDNRT